MIQWLRDNPAKRKTASGMPRFINSWLSRIEPKPKTPQPKTFEQKKAEQEAEIDEYIRIAEARKKRAAR
jgi:uncharacterized damage-inducible protein DinB